MQPLRSNATPIRRELRPGRGLVYEKLSDPILVTRAKDGDRLALEALCARHAPKVERLARHLLRDPDDASDAAQEALAKLCVRLKQKPRAYRLIATDAAGNVSSVSYRSK